MTLESHMLISNIAGAHLPCTEVDHGSTDMDPVDDPVTAVLGKVRNEEQAQ